MPTDSEEQRLSPSDGQQEYDTTPELRELLTRATGSPTVRRHVDGSRIPQWELFSWC
jgi:hypothetical protein